MTRLMLKSKPVNSAAFTRTELLVMIAIMGFFTALLGGKFFFEQAWKRRDSGHPRFVCIANLKQIALACRIWEGDKGDHYPMSYYTNATGEQLFANAALAYRYFQVLSNELNDPKNLICPEDRKHLAATNWSNLNSSNISYFIALDADELFPQRFLAGDAHLTNGQPLQNGTMKATPQHPASWTTERHHGEGNILMADGSVQQFSTPALQTALQHTGLATNRLLIPQ